MLGAYNIEGNIRSIRHQYYTCNDGLTILMVISGTVMVRVWARETQLSEGDFVIFNHGDLHRITTVSANNLVIQINFSSDFCRCAYNKYDESVVICNSARYEQLNKAVYNLFRKKLSLLLLCFGRADDYRLDHKVNGIAKELIEYACDYFDYVSRGFYLKNYSERVVLRNRKLLLPIKDVTNDNQTRTLKDISQELNISYSYLRKDIKERYGVGFNYIKYFAMTEKAARMLIDTSYNATLIGFHCGFSDYKYMTKYFNILYECSPLEFRKRHLKFHHLEEAQYVEFPLEAWLQFFNHFK